MTVWAGYRSGQAPSYPVDTAFGKIANFETAYSSISLHDILIYTRFTMHTGPRKTIQSCPKFEDCAYVISDMEGVEVSANRSKLLASEKKKDSQILVSLCNGGKIQYS